MRSSMGGHIYAALAARAYLLCARYFIGTAGLVSGTHDIGLVSGTSRTPLTVRAYLLCASLRQTLHSALAISSRAAFKEG